MTYLKKLFAPAFAALALLCAALPVQAANKKAEPKTAAKKEAPKGKKDSADSKKQPAAKRENPAKEPTKGKKEAVKGKKDAGQENKKNAKKEAPAKEDKAKGGKKDSAKDKKEAAKDKGRNAKDSKQKTPAGKADEAKKKGKADTAKKNEAGKAAQKKEPAKKDAAKEEPITKEPAKKDAAKHEGTPKPQKPETPPVRDFIRPETPFPPAAQTAAPQTKPGYDESAMQALVRQQAEKEKQKERQAAKTAEAAMSSGSPVSRREADELIGSAMGLLGVSYRFGGTSVSSGFDCSGFMQHIFRKTMQVNLPRTSAEQARMGVGVSRSELQPGDMVFFRTSRGRISHVGLYIGNNRFIHAPRTGKSIEITSLSNKYWNSRYALARRIKRFDSGRFAN